MEWVSCLHFDLSLAMAIHSSKSFEMPLLLSAFSNVLPHVIFWLIGLLNINLKLKLYTWGTAPCTMIKWNQWEHKNSRMSRIFEDSIVHIPHVSFCGNTRKYRGLPRKVIFLTRARDFRGYVNRALALRVTSSISTFLSNMFASGYLGNEIETPHTGFSCGS